MPGHTFAGTLQEGPPWGPLPGVDAPDELLPGRHAPNACCWESHPASRTVPESEQVGCTDSMQRRYASASEAQDGVIEATAAQLIGQSLPPPVEHPARAILPHVAEQEAATSAGVQLSPHVANGPASPSSLVSAPPHPTAEPRATSVAP
jgi:hypothetical protein